MPSLDVCTVLSVSNVKADFVNIVALQPARQDTVHISLSMRRPYHCLDTYQKLLIIKSKHFAKQKYQLYLYMNFIKTRGFASLTYPYRYGSLPSKSS